MAAAGIGGVCEQVLLLLLLVCCDDAIEPVLPEDVDDDESSGRFSAGLLLRNESLSITGARTGRIECMPMMVPLGGSFPLA